jgi:hypothetical protein
MDRTGTRWQVWSCTSFVLRDAAVGAGVIGTVYGAHVAAAGS